MSPWPLPRPSGVVGWRIAAIVASAALYLVAVSDTAYELTSPLSLPHHVVFRKLYAVAAFTAIGYLCERSAIPRLSSFVGTVLLLGLYSYAIEIGQIVFDQSTESFFQHGFDVASGALGGALGSALVRIFVFRSALSARHSVAIALMIALLVVVFFPTYGATR